jgi:S-adenosylmethionine synthetase
MADGRSTVMAHFSGKATKVDRSQGYMARYIAKNLVASRLADECLVQLAYCIGRVDPVSVMINTYGTGKRPDTDFLFR